MKYFVEKLYMRMVVCAIHKWIERNVDRKVNGQEIRTEIVVEVIERVYAIVREISFVGVKVKEPMNMNNENVESHKYPQQ